MPAQGDEAHLRTVVDTAVDGMILIDVRGRILMFNPACERLFGYGRDEVMGRNVSILMPEPHSGEHDGYIESYRRTGKAKIIGKVREVVGRRKDGSTFPMGISVGEAKQDGEPTFVGIVHDLTERHRAALAEREAAGRMKAVLDTAVDGIILMDADGRVMMSNPACERLFGYGAEEVLGQNVKMLMPTPFREEHDEYLQNYFRTGERKIIGIGREVVGRRKDGSTFPLEISVGEAKQEGKSIFVGVIHDLSRRKRTEEQLVQAQKMEVVGQLSGGIAHDFNNLLTVIIGNADMLADSLEAQEKLKRLAEQIVTAGQRGAELTQRLLAFGRKQVLRPVEIDCNQLVDAMRELLRRALREDIRIVTQLEPGLCSAYADPGQLESAILNLSLNARDAMPDGGCLTIATANLTLDQRYRSMHPDIPPGEYVVVAVTDDGAGMTPAVRGRAFEPFFTTKEVGKGSGLGLSMVYGFAKQSNGHVTLYSEPGLGTTVRIYLPATSAPPAGAAASTPELAVPHGQGTVLVVEDDAFVRGYAVICLESLGYRVIAVIDGHEALARLAQAEQIDLLFSDIVMPGGMNGLELIERAKHLRPGLKVLLASGYALETLTARGRLDPAVNVLNKPYRKIELARRVREVLDTQ